jgi:hypothetical protein
MRKIRRKVCLIRGLAGSVGLMCALARADGLVVHEWGTFTTIHQASGSPLSRLNKIEETEVLPDFVHRFEPGQTRQFPLRSFGKSPAVPGRPDVTMRLETPVLYFYPPANGPAMGPIDVTVRFRGGIINEFYPDATAAAGFDDERIASKLGSRPVGQWDGAVLNDYVAGSLEWKGLALGETFKAPLTDNPVWIAPRAVRSSGIVAGNGEGERYLFYRGVAHLDALFQTQLTPRGLRLSAPARFTWFDGTALRVLHLWVVQVRRDGLIAFRESGEVVLSRDRPGVTIAQFSVFPQEAFVESAARRLRESMRNQLEWGGLFGPEAEAMLNTWKASYFEKPGLRVFYMVPAEWTNYFLPLKISVPAVTTRVFVGRIDIVN